MINKVLDDKINRGGALFMVFSPIFFLLFGVVWWISIGISIAWVVLWLKDIDIIKEEGLYVDSWKYVGIIGLLIPPVYFWVRKLKTNTGVIFPILSTILWIVALTVKANVK